MPEGAISENSFDTVPQPENGTCSHEWVDVYGRYLSGTQDCVVGQQCTKCKKYEKYSEPEC